MVRTAAAGEGWPAHGAIGCLRRRVVRQNVGDVCAPPSSGRSVTGRRRWVGALLLPLGVVVSHVISYVAAHPSGADRARALGSMHAHLAPLAVIGAVGALAAVLAAGRGGYRGRRLPITATGLAAGQAALFTLMELAERVAADTGLGTALGERTLWIGVAVQFGIARLSVWLLRVGEAAGAAFRSRRQPLRATRPLSDAPPADAVVRTVVLSPLSRRGPPAVASS